MRGITHINNIPFLIPSLVLMPLFYSRQEVGGKGWERERRVGLCLDLEVTLVCLTSFTSS